jgi:aspartyl-tRNA(Asn)/glutamyl-tRNA(Gln) amidotransferase subunit C
MDAEELYATARMARLTLMPQEVEKLRQAVEQMLGYFSHMKGLDVTDLKPTTHALFQENRLREDQEHAWAFPDLLLDNAPEREARFILIPNVL